MSDDLVKQFIAELQDLVQCRCHEAFKGRGLHDPDCHCDTAEAVKVVTDRIAELEAKLAEALEALRDIARQKRTDELASKHCAEFADFEGGYDACVDVARTTIAELAGGKDE